MWWGDGLRLTAKSPIRPRETFGPVARFTGKNRRLFIAKMPKAATIVLGVVRRATIFGL